MTGHLGITLKTSRRNHRDEYRHASFGDAAPAFCVNYTAVRLYMVDSALMKRQHNHKSAAYADC